MSDTTIERRKDALIVYRIAQIEQDLEALKTNQAKKLNWGNIVADATVGNGKITVGNITIDGDGFITVSDGTNNRILLGFQASGF